MQQLHYAFLIVFHYFFSAGCFPIIKFIKFLSFNLFPLLLSEQQKQTKKKSVGCRILWNTGGVGATRLRRSKRKRNSRKEKRKKKREETAQHLSISTSIFSIKILQKNHKAHGTGDTFFSSSSLFFGNEHSTAQADETEAKKESRRE